MMREHSLKMIRMTTIRNRNIDCGSSHGLWCCCCRGWCCCCHLLLSFVGFYCSWIIYVNINHDNDSRYEQSWRRGWRRLLLPISCFYVLQVGEKSAWGRWEYIKWKTGPTKTASSGRLNMELTLYVSQLFVGDNANQQRWSFWCSNYKKHSFS